MHSVAYITIDLNNITHIVKNQFMRLQWRVVKIFMLEVKCFKSKTFGVQSPVKKFYSCHLDAVGFGQTATVARHFALWMFHPSDVLPV